MQKRRQNAYDEQRREQKAIWEEEKRRRSLITDAQAGFIEAIAETLGIEKPDIEKKADASDWIDAHIGEYQKKHKEIQAARRAEEHAERLHRASSLRESGLGTKDIATKMGLTPGTIRKYLKELDSQK